VAADRLTDELVADVFLFLRDPVSLNLLNASSAEYSNDRRPCVICGETLPSQLIALAAVMLRLFDAAERLWERLVDVSRPADVHFCTLPYRVKTVDVYSRAALSALIR